MASPGPHDDGRPPYRTHYKRKLQRRKWGCFVLAIIFFAFGTYGLVAHVFLALVGFMGGALALFGWDYYGRKLKGR